MIGTATSIATSCHESTGYAAVQETGLNRKYAPLSLLYCHYCHIEIGITTREKKGSDEGMRTETYVVGIALQSYAEHLTQVAMWQ